MLNPIDNFLNRITMYKLVLYYLIVLNVFATILSFMGILSFTPQSIIISTIFLLGVGLVTNYVFAMVFKATPNIESVYISVLILSLIITPGKSPADFAFLFWAALWTMAGKYIFAYKNRHIFNPAAFGIFLPVVFLQQSASWWVGTLPMVVPVLLGGLLMIRKIEREVMAEVFIAIVVLTVLALSFSSGVNLITLLQKIFTDSATLFFAFVMLTEPLTTPPTKNLRIIYAILIGVLYPPQVHFGNLYLTPELALLIGNVFSYFVSSKERLTLVLQEKIQIAKDTYDFVFQKIGNFNFNPGQYLEWTLDHDRADSRGNRRYFTLASSPTENNFRIGVKFNPDSSSFKKSLVNLNPGEKISAATLAGDFTLPKDKSKKLVFIAGGIGITPFRSILKYLIDNNEKRDIVLFYANKTADEIVYKDIINEAKEKLGLKAIFTLTDEENVPPSWQGQTGRINDQMIMQYVPDFIERTHFISGPHAMVDAYKKVLRKLGVPGNHIVTDFFPGFV